MSFNKCLNYENCSPNERLIQGNNEQYCLGAHELCLKFKRQEFTKNREDLSPYELINRIVRRIFIDVKSALKKKVEIAIIDSDLNLIHLDSSVREAEISFIRRYLINNYTQIKLGEFSSIVYESKTIGIYKVIKEAVVTISVENGITNELKSLVNDINKYENDLTKGYETFKDHLLMYKEYSLASSSKSISDIFNSLKNLVEEEIPALKLANHLQEMRDDISKVFAWHPVLMEMESFARDKLNKYPKNSKLKKKDKVMLLDNVENWKKRLHV